MKMPEPGTEAFESLGPEARTLARWRNNSTPLNRSTDPDTPNRNLTDFQESGN